LAAKVDDPVLVAAQERIAGDEGCIRPPLQHRGERPFEFIRIAYWSRGQLQAQGRDGDDKLVQKSQIGVIVRIPQERHAGHGGNAFPENLQTLANEIGRFRGQPGYISPRSRKAGREACSQGVADRPDPPLMGWSGRAPAPLLEKLAGGAKLKEPAMPQTLNSAIAVIGTGIGKNSFHVIGQNRHGAIVLRQKWSRGQVEVRLANTQPCLIGMEACVGAHHLSRKLQALGHDARLMPAKYVRPYSKGEKNDYRDAEAIAEAVQRPTMKFVATKTAEQLDLQALHRVRQRLVGQRTSIINQIRAFLLERGIAVRQGLHFLRAELPAIRAYVSSGQLRTCLPLGLPPLCATSRPEQVQQNRPLFGVRPWGRTGRG
jgi:Transposase